MTTTIQSRTFTASALISGFLEAYGTIALAANTQANYRAAERAHAKYNGDSELTFLSVRRMVNGLTADGIQPCTINGYLGSLHTVLKYAVKLGIAPVDFMDKDLMPRLRQTERVHQNVTDTLDYDAILNTVETARDRALLALLGVASMRKGEVIALNVEDIFPHEGGYKLLIRQAKAQAQRWAILPEAYADALREHLKSVQSGAVFTARKTGKRLNSRSVNWIVNQYAEYSPHKYRHAGAERLYAAGASTEDIASILGNTISTCERVYRGVNLDRMTATANLLKPAY